MFTELMIILIAVGAAIIFVVWLTTRRRQKQDTEDIEESTDKFRVELESAANQIIARMESQATRVESLLDDSERNRMQLEGRIAELKKLVKRSENQTVEIRELLAKVEEAAGDVDAMQRKIQAVERRYSPAPNQKTSPPQPQQTISPALLSRLRQAQAAAKQEPKAQPAPQPATFAKVLEKASAPTQTAIRGPAILPRQPAPQNPDDARLEAIRQNLIKNAAKLNAQQKPAPAPNTQAKILAERQGKPIKSPPPKPANPQSIKDMILNGMTVEEIARETGLGRGAIELVQQMMRHQLEKH